jgi:hypothetical protein
MQKCPKCATVYSDESKICRTCGSILEASSELGSVLAGLSESEPELLTAANVVDDLPRDESLPMAVSAEDPPAWTCSQCKKSVPGNFDICWNCFTTRDGDFDPEFAEIVAAAEIAEDQDDFADDEPPTQATNRTAASPSVRENRLCCSRCGSDKIIRDARLCDQGQNSDGKGYIMVYGDPEAWILKDRRYGLLIADICGRCGHVEFRVNNPTELYEHYRKSRR